MSIIYFKVNKYDSVHSAYKLFKHYDDIINQIIKNGL